MPAEESGLSTPEQGTIVEATQNHLRFLEDYQHLASPFGAPSPVTLNLRRRGSHVVASGSGPVGDYMQLEAFQGSTLRFRALFTLNRFNQYSIAFPSVLGTSGLRVRVFQDWMGQGRAAQKSI